MIRFLILITLVILAHSCNHNNFNDTLDQLYGSDKVDIDNLDVEVVYLNNDKLTKVKNLLTINALYIEKDSLLRLKDEEYKELYKSNSSCLTKMNENRAKLQQNKEEHAQLIKEIQNEIQNNKNEVKNSLKYYFLFYVKNRDKKYSMILDRSFNVIFAQDPLLKVKQ